MDDSEKNHTRKTITLTHKQAGIAGGGLLGAIALITQLNGMYFPRSEAENLSKQIAEVKEIVKDGFARQEQMLFAHESDELHKHERMVDTLRIEIKAEKDDRVREFTLIEGLIKRSKNN